MEDVSSDPLGKDPTSFTMDWDITNTLDKRKQVAITSPTFQQDKKTSWFMRLYPENSPNDYASIYLHGLTKGQMRCIKIVKFSINSGDRYERKSVLAARTVELVSPCTESSIGLKKFVHNLFRLCQDNLSYGDVAIIKCEIMMESEIDEPTMEPQMGSALSSDLERIFKSKQFSDFKIKCGGRVIGCSKILLAARSKEFETMFQKDTVESRTGEVVIEDIEPEVMEEVVKFIYTDKVDEAVLHQMAPELLAAGNKYELTGLKKITEAFLAKDVNSENACELLHLAKQFSLEHLKEKAMELHQFSGPLSNKDKK